MLSRLRKMTAVAPKSCQIVSVFCVKLAKWKKEEMLFFFSSRHHVPRNKREKQQT